jgi:hypothetical protein
VRDVRSLGFFWTILHDMFNPTGKDYLSHSFFNGLANPVCMGLVVPWEYTTPRNRMLPNKGLANTSVN